MREWKKEKMRLIIEVDEIPNLDSIIRYLEKTGWKYYYTRSKFLIYIKEDDPLASIALPDSDGYSDYERRITEVFRSISAYEKRDEYKIYQQMRVDERDRLLKEDETT